MDGNDMTNRLILTVGLPRSGKTTIALKMGCPIVSPDAIRLSLHGQVFYPDAEPMVWTIAKIMVASLFEVGHPTVILDACNITHKRRKEWHSTKWDTTCRFVYPIYDDIKMQKITCQNRVVLTNREDLIPVIERMATEFEPIDKAIDDNYN